MTNATATTTKKVTLATIKSFIRKNKANLYIMYESHFDGMIDGVRYFDDTKFEKAVSTDKWLGNTLGVSGAWFVGGSRNYFSTYNKDGFFGYHVYNCCGSFTLAVKQ